MRSDTLDPGSSSTLVPPAISHSPSPWRVFNRRGRDGWYVHAEDCTIVAVVTDAPNIAVIENAPELLVACRELLAIAVALAPVAPRNNAVIDAARSVIDRASVVRRTEWEAVGGCKDRYWKVT